MLSLTLGILTIEFPLYDLVLTERTKMPPGLPGFDIWVKPEPEVRLSVYIFAIENAEAFLNGTDTKIKLKEIGPIIYKENLSHEDVAFFKNNSTMSYTAVRNAEFLPNANLPGILNETITVPNFAILVRIY